MKVAHHLVGPGEAVTPPLAPTTLTDSCPRPRPHRKLSEAPTGRRFLIYEVRRGQFQRAVAKRLDL